MLFVKYQSIWTASSFEDLLIFTKFYPFLGPNRCHPLDLRNLESPFSKDASYQIWFKLVQWFCHLKESFMDGRTTDRRTAHDHNSSLEPLAQVS